MAAILEEIEEIEETAEACVRGVCVERRASAWACGAMNTFPVLEDEEEDEDEEEEEEDEDPCPLVIRST